MMPGRCGILGGMGMYGLLCIRPLKNGCAYPLQVVHWATGALLVTGAYSINEAINMADAVMSDKVFEKIRDLPVINMP